MQLTPEQIIQLIVLTAVVMLISLFSYRCGLRDKNEQINSLKNKYRAAKNHCEFLEIATTTAETALENNARAIELLNDELEAANLIKNRQLNDIAATQLLLEIERTKSLADDQHKTISQSAAQLLLTAQFMDAIKNQESAKTQRKLAKQLQEINAQTNEPSPIKKEVA